MSKKFLNPTLAYCVRTSKDDISCIWVNPNDYVNQYVLFSIVFLDFTQCIKFLI